MMPEPTFELDTSEFEAALAAYAADTGKSFAEVVRMQSRLLITRLIEWTPPLGSGRDAQQKQQKKIDADIRRVFTDFGEFKFANLHIQKAWSQGDKAALENIFKDSPRLSSYQLMAKPDPALHQKARFKGKVPKRDTAKFVIMGGKNSTGGRELERYIKSVQKRAGKAKSGWVAASRALAAKFPSWITKAGGVSLGDVRDNTGSMNNPSVIMRNAVSYISVIFPDCKLQNLLNSRVVDMEKNAQKYIDARKAKYGF